MKRTGFAEYWRSKKANRQENDLLEIGNLADKLHIPDAIVEANTLPLTPEGANDPAVCPPVSPGQVIQAALDHIRLNQSELAVHLGVSRQMMNYIIHGRKGLTVENAIRIEELLHIPAHVLLRLQADYDLFRVRRITPPEDPIAPHSTI